MPLYEIVLNLLKKKNEPLAWLATELDMTADGLKLSLKKETMKHSKLSQMAELFEVSPAYFFPDSFNETNSMANEEDRDSFPYLKQELAICKEMVETLKSQVKDKDRIIAFLENEAKREP